MNTTMKLLFLFLYNCCRVVKIGDREVDYSPSFRLILHTKLANPHYKPEMQAQTTLINFTVTKDGLEVQLLAEVVKAERPDLETLKVSLKKKILIVHFYIFIVIILYLLL